MAAFINKSLYLSIAIPFASRYILQSELFPVCSNIGLNLKGNEILRNLKIDASSHIRLLKVNSKYMNTHQASSNAFPANKGTFLNEANKLQNTTLDCVTDTSDNKSEFVITDKGKEDVVQKLLIIVLLKCS